MKKIILLFIVFTLIMALVACGTSNIDTEEASQITTTEEVTENTLANENENTNTDNSEITIAYAASEMTNEIFAMQVKAMEEYCEEIGVNFVYKSGLDVSKKLAAIENFIQMGVDVIIVHVTDASSFEGAMKEAQAAGIKFFAYDTNIEGSDAYYGWDNYEYGQAIGRNAAEWVKATFDSSETVNAFSSNYPELDFTLTRENGYKDAINEACPNVVWVGEGKAGEASEGLIAGENWLQKGVPINLVVGINDGGCLGVYEAFKAAGYEGDDVGIFAGDATNDAIKAIADGGIYRGTVSTDLVKLAPEFIDICVNMANGGEGGEHYGPTTLITPENVADYQ